MKLTLKKMPKAKRIILVSVGLLLVTAVGLFAYAEYSSSQQVKTSDRAYSEARQGIYDQLSVDELTTQSLIDIESAANQASEGLCKSSFIAQWRISSDDQAACETHQQQLLAVSNRASAVTERLKTEQLVAKVFDSAAGQLAEVKTGDYQAQKKIWSQASQGLADITAADAYQDHLEAHQSAVKQIIERYDSLLKAEKAQKRNQFDDATTELQQAYESLDKTKTDTQASYREQADALLEAIESLS